MGRNPKKTSKVPQKVTEKSKKITVKKNSHLKNLTAYVVKCFKGDETNSGKILGSINSLEEVMFISAEVASIGKTISCAEIVKREVPNLYQLNRIYRPNELNQLENFAAKTKKKQKDAEVKDGDSETPKNKSGNIHKAGISILLSKLPKEDCIVGYQGKRSFEEIWQKEEVDVSDRSFAESDQIKKLLKIDN